MRHSYISRAKKILKDIYQLDLIKDILLIRNDQVMLFLDHQRGEPFVLEMISGSLSTLGFEDQPSLPLDAFFEAFDYDNKYGEINGKQSYYQEVRQQVYQFDKFRDVSFPINSQKGRKWLRLNVLPCPKNHNISIFTITDVTRLHTQEEETFAKSHVDSLTNVYNKYTFDYHYGQVYLKDGFHVMFMDIDNLKKINDQFGHTIGNECLIAFANVLKSFQTEDIKFYRLGGDEFAGLIVGEEEQVKKMAQSVIDQTKAIKIDHHDTQFSVSIGIVKAVQSDGVARKADQLMYRIKQSGKGYYKYQIEDDE